MTTADTSSSASPKLAIEQRLDALDRTLLGLLPRSERLEFVAKVETRVRELGSDALGDLSPAEAATEVYARTASATSKRRSRLALSSGILGIIALAMLFAMPITYIFVATIGEGLGEFVSISLLSIHVLTVAIGGLAALIMGIAGLVSLARRKGRLVGHGWAITGLCTAPLPTLIGGLMVLVTSLSLFAVQAVSVQGSPVVTASGYVPAVPAGYGEPTTWTPSGPSPYASSPSGAALPMPTNLPLPLPPGAPSSFPANNSLQPQSCPAPSLGQPESPFIIPGELSSYEAAPACATPPTRLSAAPAAPAKPAAIPASAATTTPSSAVPYSSGSYDPVPPASAPMAPKP